MKSKLTLSATNLASHHHLQCDLFLHNVYYGSPSRAHTAKNQSSGLTEAQLERGNDWEATLLAWLDAQGLLLTVFSAPLDATDLRELVILDERDHFFIAGLKFWPPQKALDENFVRAGRQPVEFGLFKPDLLEITRLANGSIEWRVIDAKASTGVKTSHFVQVYFYSLCLRLLLQPPLFCAMGSAAIWLPPKDLFESPAPSSEDLKTFDLSLMSDSVERFLFHQLPDILESPRESVRYHYNPLCRSCPFNAECRTRALSEGTIGSMPNISLEQAKVLGTLLSTSRKHGQNNGVSDIEELHGLVENPSRLKALEKSFPSTVTEAKRILGISTPRLKATNSSAMVEAAVTRTIQVKHRRNFTCPRREDIAIVLSLVQDPASSTIAAYCISVFSTVPAFTAVPPVVGKRETLVSSLAFLINHILNSHGAETTLTSQFYVFSTNEEAALQRHLIDLALTVDPDNHQMQSDIQTCIGALSEGATLLATLFQPLILGGALLDFLSKRSHSKATLKLLCLERLGLPSDGTADQLRARVEDELQRLKVEGGRASATKDGDSRRAELGQLPRIVILKKEVERLLALPISGYWDLPECAAMLLRNVRACNSDDDIFILYKNSYNFKFQTAIKKRNRCIYNVLHRVRKLVSCQVTQRPELLVNDARVLSAHFLDICQHKLLRKLFFMQQFEILTRLTELWNARIDGCPDAPILEFRGSALTPSVGILQYFNVISGNVDLPSDKDRAFYNYLLVEDEDILDSVPLEALFDDLGVLGTVFPLSGATMCKWTEQHPSVQAKVWVADVRDKFLKAQKSTVVIRAWGAFRSKFVVGRRYRLSPRLVDFNVSKILSTLVELDLQYGTSVQSGKRHGDDGLGESSRDCEVIPFMQLISDPQSLGKIDGCDTYAEEEELIHARLQRLYRDGQKAAGILVLKHSQRIAAACILEHRLSVVWGPPGTGKTHTIALSLLRLLEIESRLRVKNRRIIFLTAVTHAAIQACLNKLQRLAQNYREVEGPLWLDHVQIEHVVQGNSHLGPVPNSTDAYVYAGTVYQLYNFSKRFSFKVDCVVIDEAGQLALNTSALVLRRLAPMGRIIIAGDSEQLAPIFSAQYPILVPHLFGSILDCLMQALHKNQKPLANESTQQSISPNDSFSVSLPKPNSLVVQLRENFRLNPDLGRFVSTIYDRTFKPQKEQVRAVAERLKSLSQVQETDFKSDVVEKTRLFLVSLSHAMLLERQDLLMPPSYSTNEEKLGQKQLGQENLGHRSISLALIHLRTRSRNPDSLGYETYVRGEAAVAAALVSLIQRCSPSDDIFVATPHRIQRQVVREAILSHSTGEENVVAAMEHLSLGAEIPLAGKVTVDTVERLQGSEAAFVICLFSLPTTPGASSKNASFLLERRRLNVAISRAKTMCILITSDSVSRPSVSVLSKEASAKGYLFLRAFQQMAWSTTMEIDLDQ